MQEAHTWFEIAMKITTLVHVGKGLKYLKAPISDIILWKGSSPVFHKLVQIALLVNKKLHGPVLENQIGCNMEQQMTKTYAR